MSVPHTKWQSVLCEESFFHSCIDTTYDQQRAVNISNSTTLLPNFSKTFYLFPVRQDSFSNIIWTTDYWSFESHQSVSVVYVSYFTVATTTQWEKKYAGSLVKKKQYYCNCKSTVIKTLLK